MHRNAETKKIATIWGVALIAIGVLVLLVSLLGAPMLADAGMSLSTGLMVAGFVLALEPRLVRGYRRSSWRGGGEHGDQDCRREDGRTQREGRTPRESARTPVQHCGGPSDSGVKTDREDAGGSRLRVDGRNCLRKPTTSISSET